MAKVVRYAVRGVLMLLVIFSASGVSRAQTNYTLRVKVVDTDSGRQIERLQLKSQFQNQSQLDEYLQRLPLILQSKGYLSSSVDSVVTLDSIVNAYLYLGQRYKGLQLTYNGDDKQYLQQANWPDIKKSNNFISFENYSADVEKLLDHFEGIGYPFSKVSLDSVRISADVVEAKLKIEKGNPYRIDSIRLFGPARISRNFIHRYLGIERGGAYNKKKLDKINQRLLELPYLEQIQPWNVTMLNTGSLVNLYLKPRKSNQVNILAGFLPENQQLGGKLLLTVDANLRLQNAFGSGETVGLVWQQIQPKSPRINLNWAQPFILNSSFGTDFSFELFKKDSAFLNINAQLGLMYLLTANKTAKIIIQTQRTNLLDIDTSAVKATKRLPNVADVSSLSFGINYDLTNTDYKFNPRKGSELSLTMLAGNKTIRRNTTITTLKGGGFNFGALYDTVKLKTYQLRFRFRGTHYFQTGKFTAVKTAVNAGLFESPSKYRNELFQIGGYRLLRGFDEESIFTDKYAVGTVEFRYLLGLNSNFSVFTDYGLSRNGITFSNNSYLGAGLGLSFETKGGIFNISYAAGKRDDLPFSLKQSKIHFGFVSIF